MPCRFAMQTIDKAKCSPNLLQNAQKAASQIGATIQDNEQSLLWPFQWHPECCKIHHECNMDFVGGGTHEGIEYHYGMGTIKCENNKHLMKAFGCRPNRCLPHGKEVKTFIRTKKWKLKLKKKFKKNRHLFVRMLTLGLPGIKHHPLEDLDQVISEYRKYIVGEFHTLRERQIWKDVVDGGMWFFEVTIDIQPDGMVKVNPHLHMPILCNKKLPIKELNQYLADPNGINLGRAYVSVPKDKEGKFKKHEAQDAINYCMSYLKKDEQLNGRNRQTFGCLFG